MCEIVTYFSLKGIIGFYGHGVVGYSESYQVTRQHKENRTVPVRYDTVRCSVKHNMHKKYDAEGKYGIQNLRSRGFEVHTALYHIKFN